MGPELPRTAQARKNMGAPDSPEAAMNSALAAEKAAGESVRRCSEQAAQRLAEAREQARRIAARTDTRIGRLHAICSENNARRIRRLEEEEDSGSGPWGEKERGGIMDDAISRVAAQLTGGSAESL